MPTLAIRAGGQVRIWPLKQVGFLPGPPGRVKAPLFVTTLVNWAGWANLDWGYWVDWSYWGGVPGL